MGALWARFAAVAATNPNAWVRSAPSAEQIAAPAEGNPWIAYPYTKLLVANAVVDQAAALILCSAEAAQRAGVPESRWIYPVAATEAVVSRHVSERMELYEEPPQRLAGLRALELAGVEPAALDFVDLYSCFPSAVQLGATALGLDLERPLTVTGGLTFAGGPLNSYVIHAIATTMARLRERPDAKGARRRGGRLLLEALLRRVLGPAAGRRLPLRGPRRRGARATRCAPTTRSTWAPRASRPTRSRTNAASPRARCSPCARPTRSAAGRAAPTPPVLAALEREDWVGRPVRVREDRSIEPCEGRSSRRSRRGTGGSNVRLLDERPAPGDAGSVVGSLATRLVAARGVRGFVDGLVSVVLAPDLSRLGFTGVEVGAIVTARCSARRAHARRRRARASPARARRAARLAARVDGRHRPRLRSGVVASGRCSPSRSSARSTRRRGDVSVFLPTEQSLLPSTSSDQQRTAVLRPLRHWSARSVAAFGSLAAGLPEPRQRRAASRATTRSAPAFLRLRRRRRGGARALSRACRRRRRAPRRPRERCALGASRRIVLPARRARSALDSFGGGFVVQSMLALWLLQRFGLSLDGRRA